MSSSTTIGFDEFRRSWLEDVQAGNPSTVELGRRFALKLVTQWLDVSDNTPDLIYCDGSMDGGIDVALLDTGPDEVIDDSSGAREGQSRLVIVMQGKTIEAPESTAVRLALWRAMHVQVDSASYVLEDEIGLKLVAPEDGWRRRPVMDPNFTRPFRASIVARARFIEDLVVEQVDHGVGQYVILGAGLDTFAQRRPEIGSRLRMFEVDQPGPQAWKRHRLIELGYGVPEWLRFVPVDFEAGDAWWQRLAQAGFDADKPAVVASTGVSMYLTKDAIWATLRKVAALAPGTTLAMTFMLPLELADPEVLGARASGTPSSASSLLRRCWRSPARPASGKSGTSRRPISPGATSQIGQMVCGYQAQRSWWWRLPNAYFPHFQRNRSVGNIHAGRRATAP